MKQKWSWFSANNWDNCGIKETPNTPDSSALGGQVRQATEIWRHQESNKTRAKQAEGHDGHDPRTEFAQKQMSISEQHEEEDGPSSWDILHILISS